MDPYEVPKARNIYHELPPVDNDLTLEDIARRVEANKAQFESKYSRRKAKQDDYYVNLKKSLSEVAQAAAASNPNSGNEPDALDNTKEQEMKLREQI